MAISELDRKYMRFSLELAREALRAGDVPVGACLTIDGIIAGPSRNRQFTNRNWFNHAENCLIKQFAADIKTARMENRPVELYTTLEPCLMCFGAAVHNRITRIVYACPDPSGGSTHIKPPTEWYERKWPVIERGPYAEESCKLMLEVMRKSPDYWTESLPVFEKLALTLKEPEKPQQ
jgi:tRNA(adenine34) deaminase